MFLSHASAEVTLEEVLEVAKISEEELIAIGFYEKAVQIVQETNGAAEAGKNEICKTGESICA